MKVKDCNNCPFRVDEYDDFSMGYDMLTFCNLAKFNNQKDWIIEAWDREHEENVNFIKPNWCPLKEGDIEIQLEEINE